MNLLYTSVSDIEILSGEHLRNQEPVFEISMISDRLAFPTDPNNLYFDSFLSLRIGNHTNIPGYENHSGFTMVLRVKGTFLAGVLSEASIQEARHYALKSAINDLMPYAKTYTSQLLHMIGFTDSRQFPHRLTQEIINDFINSNFIVASF